jgi:hypothetical protein
MFVVLKNNMFSIHSKTSLWPKVKPFLSREDLIDEDMERERKGLVSEKIKQWNKKREIFIYFVKQQFK